MELQTWTPGLLLLAVMVPPAEALVLPYDPRLCYILDGFLGLYGLIITGMFIKEKFFRSKVKGGGGGEESLYTDLRNPGGADYAPLVRDPERGRNRRVPNDDTYTDLSKRTDGEYKELPARRERQRKNDQVYQGLSAATRDTYDSLQMQPLPPR
ncbi:T-cell surface glycoprotein CD3 zeta chain-like [Parambassis ranga]|uniref:T-cell surface glycoprotein CD3 zeta chain n=1 Tax=Parambassis ranga TaxID=210632 RepID=A0A6P7HPA8_9TELE|nr:T-cell surface glycoprotein CD3 zeta chain-like [Parambassis ranga]